LHPETLINYLKGYKGMKRTMRMRMQDVCCCRQMMMTMMMKEGIYIIGINKIKKKQYEKDSINNSSIIQYQHQQYLG
jgi:hypothetical protein